MLGAVAVTATVTGLVVVPTAASAATVGAGFTVTPSDLAFILQQIKIGEQHAATQTPANPCGTLVGPGPNQIANRLSSYGLRTVDGSCNNLFPGRETFAAADQVFPRLAPAEFQPAEAASPPFGVGGATSYAQTSGVVVDSEPRTVSNLIVDQTAGNPAALAAAAFPVRTQGNPGVHPCTTDPEPTLVPPVDGIPAGCVPSHQTLFIPNVTTDVGLSPPYNSIFTFFGQFFDHGVDQTVKGGGTVFVPLKADDPLIAGPDHVPGNADDLPPSLRFMVLTRSQNQTGADGVLGTADDVRDAANTDTPWIDQSQTYASHASHQVFLREYELSPTGRPVSNGRLLGGPAGQETGMATWASTKAQAALLLGLALTDRDVTDVPMIATDPYGKFVPGPARGLPQYVTGSGLVEGDRANPVPVPADVVHIQTPFLTDIAHNADPSPADTDNNPATPKVAPIPDADTTASADFASQAPGTYDDEMLAAHFIAGDGRVNENIALTSIHQVFHSEHDRLVGQVKQVLTSDTSPTGVAALAQWRSADGTPDGWNGERLFQAARFINEMEYQHTVFEEFGRKVQPAVHPFHVYSPDVNPATTAEFAHAVYRFGHSMLDEDVVRTNADGSPNSLPLLKAFLNPPAFLDGGSAGRLTPEAATGSIFMGSSDQAGNELDEFVTDTLRNNLLGLPLDLATLNMARAREAGVPTLNGLRRSLHGTTNDGQLAPYTSWSDFGQHLKHPESLVNFVAAYGTHPSVTGQTTLAGKRTAARLLVDPASGTDPNLVPADAADFVFGAGTWADAGGVTTTGLEDVDLWVGGLAEVTNLNGGLLGSTFNYVFQTQLEQLQDGDRLYYLARTPGMNLRAQLESNSFAEMIQRNTTGTTALKADSFATADCRFQLPNLAGTPAGFTASGATVADDPVSDCDESKLLLRRPDGTIAYRAINSVDPSGINGQSVYQGGDGTDRVAGGNDNDTLWGGPGRDVIEGGGGDDVALGGDGNDIMTDLDGADVTKGGPGDDAIDAGPGNDIPMGGDGTDVINGGTGDNETFAGEGDDFVIAGTGADAVFGGGGDDWIEGGTGQDFLQGDHGAPFFDDPGQAKPGNDVFIGQPGENDYDAEGGDDIMSQNAAVDRNAGAGGFDWAIHQYDTVGADDDMMINQVLAGLPIQVVVNRDRWQETEADSGSGFNDVLRGDDIVPSALGGGGFTGCNVLDQAGIDRVTGLGAILPAPTTDPAPVVAASAAGYCPTDGPVWGAGNILLGGAGSDTITGRGADDVIDGDRAVQVRISVRTNPADPTTEIGSTNLLERPYLKDAAGAPTGPTLQAAVFSGQVQPGQLVTVREVVNATAAQLAVDVDTAVYAGPRSGYVLTPNADGSLTVTQTGANVVGQKVSDGTDTLRGIERLQFADQTVTVAFPGTPTGASAVLSGVGSATVSFTPPAATASPLTAFQVLVFAGANQVRTVAVAPTATSATITGLTPGVSYTFRVQAVNAFGPGAPSAPSNAVVVAAVVVVPTTPPAPTGVTALRGDLSATVSWTQPGNGGSPVTSSAIQVRVGAIVQRTVTATGAATSTVVTGLVAGRTYTFRVRAVTAVGTGPLSAASNPVTAATVPGSPTIASVASGVAGGASTASVVWRAPGSTGGTPITGYVVRALQVGPNGTTVVGAPIVVTVGAGARRATLTLAPARYRFVVIAVNAIGRGAPSARSAIVTAR